MWMEATRSGLTGIDGEFLSPSSRIGGLPWFRCPACRVAAFMDTTRLDDTIAYYGLLPYTSTDVQVREAARARGLDAGVLLARVTQLRSACHRLVQARVDYVVQTRDDFALLQDVANAEAAYSDKRTGPTEMDLFLIANRVAG